MKDQSLKKNIILLIIAAALLAAALNIGYICTEIHTIIGLFMPLILGGILAFILNVPMKAFEKQLNKLNQKLKKPISSSKISSISLWLAILSLTLVIILVCVLAIPEIVSSLIGLYKEVEQRIPAVSDWMSNYISEEQINNLMNIEWLQQQFTTDKITSIITNISSGTLDIIGKVFGFITSAAGSIFSVSMSFIIAVYMLLSKKKIGIQTKKVLYAFCKQSIADKICHIAELINDTYAKFLSGQFIEAFVIAIMIFVSFTISGLPYASLVAVLAAVLSFIPYIGSLMACVIGAILILFISPWKAVLSIIVFQVVQFLEGQFIYPHVVGNSVGLPALYTLLAALLGGSLFGIVGIIFFIPFFAVIYTLLKEGSDARLAKKGITIDESDAK